ncbi:MAG: DUF5131 family protein [Caldilineales bacterium]|nr:DUF5131 family protein [Caldilineales bacterium]
MEYGDLWKVDINGDGVCDGSDPAVIPWLEQEVQQLPLNRWGIAPTQNQLAFVHQWGYGGGGPHRDELKTFVEGCDAYWPLRTDTGDKIPWGSSSGNVTYWLTNVYVGGNTCMVDGQAQRYVDWYPNWLYTKLNGVSEWDGIRPDLMGNPHWLFGDADQDLDGCADNKHIGNSCNPFGPETAEGRQYLDTLYREGNQYMAQSIHQLFGPTRPNWVIVGGESLTGARPMNPTWVREIRDLCQVHRVPFLFKQWGWWTPEPIAHWKERHIFPDGEIVHFRGNTKRNGNLLDGVSHLAHPFRERLTPVEKRLAQYFDPDELTGFLVS